MLNEIIYPALIRLTRAFPPGHPSRPNSFGAVSTFGDIDSDNLNASMRDGRIGHYWGRKWEASGEASDQIQYENALVFIRKQNISFPEVNKNIGSKVCQVLEIGIASLPECEGCNGKRSDNEIEVDNALTLNNLLWELLRIEPYLVTIPTNLGGIGLSTYWLTPSEKTWLISQSVVFPTLKNCTAYLSVKKTTGLFSSFDYGTSGMIITTTPIEVCWCSDAGIEYNFRLNDFKAAAYTDCATC